MGNQPSSPNTAPADAAYRRIAWRLIPFLMLCYFCAHIDRSNIGIAKLQFTADVGLSEAAYGLGAGIFYLGYILFEVPSNLLLAKVGARITISRILVTWSLTSAAFAFITEPWHFYGLRFLLGVFEAGFFPGVLYYLSQWAPKERRARFTALFMSAMVISGVVVGPLSGSLIQQMNGVNGLAGWQWMFLLEGLPGVMLGVAAYLYLTDGPAQARWLRDDQKQIILGDLAREAAVHTPSGDVHGSLLSLLKDARFYCLAVMAAAQMSAIAGVALWAPTILRGVGIESIATIGLLAGVPYVFAIVTQQLVARSSDRMGERRWHTAIPSLIAAGGWLCLPFAKDSPVLAMVLLILATAGAFAATGPFWALPWSYLSKSAGAGGIAALSSVGGLGPFLSPIIVGWATSRTNALDTGEYFYAGLLVVGVLLMLLGTRGLPKAKPAAAGAAAVG
jgi:MFS family permease